MSIFVEEGKFHEVGKAIAPDDRKRLALGPALPSESESVWYRVYKNDLGQILLDPVKLVPAYELWLYKNPERIAAIKKGIKQIEQGKVVKINLPKEDREDED